MSYITDNSLWTDAIQRYEHEDPNATNKRIHIYFNNRKGFIPKNVQEKLELESFLNDVWSDFGKVASVYYQKEYHFAFVAFKTHDEANAAMAGIKDIAAFLKAVNTVVAKDEKREYYANMLLREGISGERLAHPSWAHACTGS